MKYMVVKNPTQSKPYIKIKVSEINIDNTKIKDFGCKEQAILKQMLKMEDALNESLYCFSKTKKHYYSAELVITKHIK